MEQRTSGILQHQTFPLSPGISGNSTRRISRFQPARFLYLLILTSIILNHETLHSQQAQVGDVAPDFTVQNLDGEFVSLSDFKGKIVMLTFFATWCAPCVVEMPIIENEIWQVYKNQGVKVLAIDQMESSVFVRDFIEAKGITYEAAIDPNGSVTSRYIQRLPHNTLINPEGIIVHTAPGLELDEIKRLIDEMLVASGIHNGRESPGEPISFTLFPNPISRSKHRGLITLLFRSTTPQTGFLHIINILGQEVQQYPVQIPTSGRAVFHIELRQRNGSILPAGYYFVQFNGSVEIITRRFTLSE